MFPEALVLSFRTSYYAREWLDTILDRSHVISLFCFWIILTWSNNLVFSSWVVSASYHTSDAHCLYPFGEWSITYFLLRTVFPRSHISIWQSSRYLVTAIGYSNSLAFPVDHCLISFSIFAFLGSLLFSGTLCAFLWKKLPHYTSSLPILLLTTSS